MSDWELVYGTDASGAVDTGSLSVLRAAVMHAADVKVMYKTGNRWWSRQCVSASIAGSGDRTIVSATCTEAVNTTARSNGLDIAGPLELEQHVYNSTGWRSRATGGAIDRSDIVVMRWYVRDYHINWIVNPDALNWINERNP